MAESGQKRTAELRRRADDELARRTILRDLPEVGDADTEASVSWDPHIVKLTVAGVAVAVALLSFFVLAPWASSPETHASTIATLDEKKGTVTALMGSSTASSAAITLLPGDLGTPIAEKLVDLSSDFLIVLAAIYLEKYLLTTMGFLAFKILLPVGCVLVAAGVGLARRRLWSPVADFGARLMVFAVAAYLVVPASTFVSSMIERTYEASIEQTIVTAQQTTEEIEAADAEVEQAQADTDTSGETSSPGLIETITGIPQALQQGVTEGVSELTEDAQRSLNNFIDALAVMIVTSCIIPILVLLCFLWLAKAIFGIRIDVPDGVFRTVPRRH